MKKNNNHVHSSKTVTGTLMWILLFCGILPFLLLLPGCHSSGFAREAGYKPGVYEGNGRGFRGAIFVSVQVSSSEIEDIIITSHAESAFPGAAAMEELLELILETGTIDVDTISGATFSSRGFLNAVDDALAKAGK